MLRVPTARVPMKTKIMMPCNATTRPARHMGTGTMRLTISSTAQRSVSKILSETASTSNGDYMMLYSTGSAGRHLTLHGLLAAVCRFDRLHNPSYTIFWPFIIRKTNSWCHETTVRRRGDGSWTPNMLPDLVYSKVLNPRLRASPSHSTDGRRTMKSLMLWK